MEGLDSSREERDGGVPRGPGGPPHQINAGPRVRENYVALTVRERLGTLSGEIPKLFKHRFAMLQPVGDQSQRKSLHGGRSLLLSPAIGGHAGECLDVCKPAAIFLPIVFDGERETARR